MSSAPIATRFAGAVHKACALAAVAMLATAIAPADAFPATCGVPFSGGTKPLGSDALYTLKSSIGTRECTLASCDASADCRITAADALLILKAAVGAPASLSCDPVCTPQIACGNAASPVCDGLCPAGYACTTPDAGAVAPDQRVTMCHDTGSGAQTVTCGAARSVDFGTAGDLEGPCPLPALVAPAPSSPWRSGSSFLAASEGSIRPSLELAAGAMEAFTTQPCSCQAIVYPTTTIVTTTTTSTSTSNTLPPAPADDQDNDGLLDADDPCVSDARNLCFGPVAIDAATGTSIRLNADAELSGECAGTRTDCNGGVWHTDFGYNTPLASHVCDINVGGGGCAIRNLATIFGCENASTEDLFQCEHFDRDPEPPLIYSFDVPNGTYLVNLYFANTYSRTRIVGSRIFDVAIEGNVVFAGLDQVALAGGSRVALVRSAVVAVSDGNGLQIEFGHVKENPTIKAIEVLAQAP